MKAVVLQTPMESLDTHHSFNKYSLRVVKKTYGLKANMKVLFVF